MSEASDLVPFRVDVPEEVLDDLRDRLARTRWPDQLLGTGWSYGTDLTYLRELCDHWRTGFDWRKVEAELNGYPQYITTVRGLRVHFLHVRSPEPSALPMVLTHGWPGSVTEFLSVIGPLTDPVAHGGDGLDAFHLVIPSLPGFGFSGPTSATGVAGRAIATAFAELMARLGYDNYVAQGGDIGAQISTLLGEIDADHVAAVHVNLLPLRAPDPTNPLAGLDGDDLERAQRSFAFLAHDTGYWQIQATRPQSLAYGLNDSPAGLAGWILEKFRSWTDCEGDIERAFTKDELLANIALYWVTGTINSSMRFYRESTGPGSTDTPPRCSVPMGYADFPGEHYRMPLAWAKERLNLVEVTTMPRGGHFAALQVPDVFVGEVRRFFRAHRT